MYLDENTVALNVYCMMETANQKISTSGIKKQLAVYTGKIVNLSL